VAVDIKNKKAEFQYFLTDRFQAGMQLLGTEVKSIRAGKASIVEGYCKIYRGELFIYNMYIAEYPNGGYVNHEPRRQRKLLLSKVELNKLVKKMKNVGYTIVPTKVYLNDKGWLKIEVAIAKGKRLRDKRDDIKQKDLKRDMDRRLAE
jgi:SsrA-binding protein